MEKIAESHKNNGVIATCKKAESQESEHGGHGGPDPTLQFTGRFGGGLMDDIKRKAPWYLSDFTDALNFQCLSSVMFMYFACLSPIITFGGLLGAATDQNMVSLSSSLY